MRKRAQPKKIARAICCGYLMLGPAGLRLKAATAHFLLAIFFKAVLLRHATDAPAPYQIRKKKCPLIFSDSMKHRSLHPLTTQISGGRKAKGTRRAKPPLTPRSDAKTAGLFTHYTNLRLVRGLGGAAPP